MGLARAIISHNEEHFPAMRDGGFLTRDSRMSERKKPGLHGARRGTQFSKRKSAKQMQSLLNGFVQTTIKTPAQLLEFFCAQSSTLI